MSIARATRFGWMVSGVVLAAATASLVWSVTPSSAQLGPINPPAGPIGDTDPDLAQLGAKLDGLEVALIGLSDAPAVTWIEPKTGVLADEDTGQLIAGGRVELVSVITHRARLYVFDGPGGTVDLATAVVSDGDLVARCVNNIFTAGGGTGIAHATTTQLDLNTIVENGLYVAWEGTNAESFVKVLYRDLPD